MISEWLIIVYKIRSYVYFMVTAMSPALPTPRPSRALLAVLLTGNFVTILDLFIVNVALADMGRALAANEVQLQLVVVAYALAYGLSLINGARLGDLYGRARLFLIGMTLFTLASGLCGLAATPWQLIAARALQGLGAGLLMPQVLASLRVLFDGAARQRAFATMGAVQGVAACISQLLGGVLIACNPLGWGWRWVFLINLPIGITVVLLGWRRLPAMRTPSPSRLDLYGAVSGTLGLAMILLPLMEGRAQGWPWWSLLAPILAVLVLAHFVHYQRALACRGGNPVLDIRLFANRHFAAGALGIFCLYSAISSFFFSLTLLLQRGLGLTPLTAGLVFTPTALAFFAGSQLSPRLAARYGRYALVGGMALFGSGLALSAVTAAFQPHNLVLLMLSLVFNGSGQGLAIPLAFNGVLGAIDERNAGIASGVLGTVQVIGTSTGVAVVGALLFAALSASPTATGVDGALLYGHALAQATVCNVIAALAGLLAFAFASRR